MEKSRVTALEGNELADDYVRTQLPKSRWSDTWNIFKSNFVKLVIINVLTLLFFVPGIAVVYFRTSYIAGLGFAFPFSSGVSLLPTPATQGGAESIVLSADILYIGLLIIMGLIASVGVAGGTYSVKKLINTHGDFTIKGYFHGVKVCFLNTAFCVTFFMLFLFGSFLISDWTALTIATGGNAAGAITAQVFMILATVLVGIYAMWVLAVGNSYKVKFRHLIKNSFTLLVGSSIQSLFMIGFALIPVWLMLIPGTLFTVLGCLIFIFIGFSFIFLVWFAFTQWVFDAFVNPAIKNEKEAAQAKMTPEQKEALRREEEKNAARELLAAGRSELIGKPIKPISDEICIPELGVIFDRSEMDRVEKDRKEMENGVSSYFEEHKGDAKFVEYEKLFAEREKALTTDKKGKKKKISSQNLFK